MNKEIEKNRPEGWCYGGGNASHPEIGEAYEAGADALIEAGYRLPATDQRGAIKTWFLDMAQGCHVYPIKGVPSAEELAEWRTDQILSLELLDKGGKP